MWQEEKQFLAKNLMMRVFARLLFKKYKEHESIDAWTGNIEPTNGHQIACYAHFFFRNTL